MITPSLPSNLANAVAPFSPVGKVPVGEESPEARETPLKPVEELSQGQRQQQRTSTGERAAQAEQRLYERSTEGDGEAEREGRGEREGGEVGASGAGREQQDADARQQEIDNQRLLAELAQRDREVRAHEQAHVAVAGDLAGAPSYEYERGPDGTRYAISGEVPISLGQVNGDPEATLRNAERVQRAALAPADPSPQDRRVAAEAAQLQREARREIALQVAAERSQEIEAEREARAEREQQTADQAARDEEARLERQQQANIDLNRRLIEIGVQSPPAPLGGLLDFSA